MFKRLETKSVKPLTISFEGQKIKVLENDNVASALLRGGYLECREAGENDMRGPFCMMGTCFECLVKIDGKPNQQACQTPVYENMQIFKQVTPSLTIPEKKENVDE